MALIPLKQSVKIIRSSGDSGGWGGSTTTEEFTLPARVDNKTQKVQNDLGDEVVSTAEIILDKLAEVYMDDVIEYVDELDRKISRRPINIEPIRMINGRAALTVVYL